MMMYEQAWLILAIFFWVLCALLIVCCMAWIYVQVQYYHWNKEERLNENIVQMIVDRVHEELENEA